jgi:hypothetical protein
MKKKLNVVNFLQEKGLSRNPNQLLGHQQF